MCSQGRYCVEVLYCVFAVITGVGKGTYEVIYSVPELYEVIYNFQIQRIYCTSVRPRKVFPL